MHNRNALCENKNVVFGYDICYLQCARNFRSYFSFSVLFIKYPLLRKDAFVRCICTFSFVIRARTSVLRSRLGLNENERLCKAFSEEYCF